LQRADHNRALAALYSRAPASACAGSEGCCALLLFLPPRCHGHRSPAALASHSCEHVCSALRPYAVEYRVELSPGQSPAWSDLRQLVDLDRNGRRRPLVNGVLTTSIRQRPHPRSRSELVRTAGLCHFTCRELASLIRSAPDSSPIHLRDHCRAADAFHPATHQRLLDTFAVGRRPSPQFLNTHQADRLACSSSRTTCTRRRSSWRARPCTSRVSIRAAPRRRLISQPACD
jgi:hypothetical protein